MCTSRLPCNLIAICWNIDTVYAINDETKLPVYEKTYRKFIIFLFFSKCVFLVCMNLGIHAVNVILSQKSLPHFTIIHFPESRSANLISLNLFPVVFR